MACNGHRCPKCGLLWIYVDVDPSVACVGDDFPCHSCAPDTIGFLKQEPLDTFKTWVDEVRAENTGK